MCIMALALFLSASFFCYIGGIQIAVQVEAGGGGCVDGGGCGQNVRLEQDRPKSTHVEVSFEALSRLILCFFILTASLN